MIIVSLIILSTLLAASAYAGCAKPGTKDGLTKYDHNENDGGAR